VDQFFNYLSEFENAMWGYVGVPALMVLGIYLCFQSRFIQITKFPLVLRTFFSFLTLHDEHKRGVHPLKAFFASLGGAVGVGNVVAICTAVQIGGPGALFWIWVTALTGMMLKYSEVFLGLKYRVPNNSGGYNGGPMYFLRHVFKKSWIPNFVALLLCIYGVEVYQFNVVVTSITSNIDFNEYVVSVVLLLFVLFAGSGGVRRVGNIASAAIPLFSRDFWISSKQCVYWTCSFRSVYWKPLFINDV
jgi:alanine or glycine:cation symporter, AGCS family